MKNERGQNMSASSMGRYYKCPASFLRGRWMPDTTSASAQRGNEIHDALEHQNFEALDASDGAVAERCNDIVLEIIEAVITPSLLKNDEGVVSREERVQSFASSYKYSGKWDYVSLWKESKVALVVDYKSGPRGGEDAEVNYQLATQALLVSQKFNLGEGWKIYVALATPMKSPQYTVASYGWQGLDMIATAIDSIAEKAHDPYAPANAGDHCRYCPARASCSERNELIGEVEWASPSAVTSPQDLSRLLDVGDLAVSAHKEHREIAKKLIVEEGLDIPGWKVQKTKGRQKIKAEPLIDRMHESGYGMKMLGTMVTVTKKGLGQVVKTKTGLAGKALNAEMERLLDGCSEEGAPSERLVKE